MTAANLTTIAALPTAGGVAASLRKDSAPAQRPELVSPGGMDFGSLPPYAPARAERYPGFEIIDIVPFPFTPDASLAHRRAVAEGVSTALVNLTGIESAASKPRPRRTPPAPWVPRMHCDDWYNPVTGQTITGLEWLQRGFTLDGLE